MEIPPTQVYGATGMPLVSDLEQTALDDCGLVSTMGTLAEEQPGAIKHQIEHVARDNSYRVTLYVRTKDVPAKVLEVTIPVTQEDLADNLARRGASTIDNHADGSGAAWPAILETAAAKHFDHNWKDGLDEGYLKLDHITQPDALMLLNGRGTDSKSSLLPGSFPAATPANAEKVYTNLKAALANHQPATLSTVVQKPDSKALDGLKDHHGYIVVGAHRGRGNQPLIDVRNTASHNNDGELPDTSNPVTSISALTLLAAQNPLIVGSKEPLPRVNADAHAGAARGEDF